MALVKRKTVSGGAELTPREKKQLKSHASEQAALRIVPASGKKKASVSDAEPPEISTKTQAKARKRKSPASPVQAKKSKKKMTAHEATMLAWQDTYAKRHKRAA